MNYIFNKFIKTIYLVECSNCQGKGQLNNSNTTEASVMKPCEQCWWKGKVISRIEHEKRSLFTLFKRDIIVS